MLYDKVTRERETLLSGLATRGPAGLQKARPAEPRLTQLMGINDQHLAARVLSHSQFKLPHAISAPCPAEVGDHSLAS